MIFERRLAAVLSIFTLTVFLLCVLEYKFITAAVIVSAILTAASFFFLRKYVFIVSAIFAAVFFCALHYNIYQKPVLNYLEEYKDTPVYIKAEIRSASSIAFMSSFELRVFEVNGEKIRRFNLLLLYTGKSAQITEK